MPRQAHQVLILGSNEGLNYTEKLQNQLNRRFRVQKLDFDCISWTEDTLVFRNGAVTLEALIGKANELKKNEGFVITLFTPDDTIEIRGEKQYCSRDNVWIEYGLFVGIMGRDRVFPVCPKNPGENGINWRKPSDFNLYEILYSCEEKEDTAMQYVALSIADMIFHSIHTPHPEPEPKEPESDRHRFMTSY